jgi:hypothetical protein
VTQPIPSGPWQPTNTPTDDCGHLPGDLCTAACQATRDLIELAWAPEWDLREVA